ncbi:MAG: DegT/DnrJ/EryC1/StrS aminotransferase family protein, partial [Burkholderiaceae bacterium]|nr:DegT/DnrJ/EryC1/StrS aminotransferase family protein [Burkholderiaceae bacterium]
MSQPFIPFTKPTIDEATIAAVADVLRSGWITSGPKVLEFESALSAYLGGATVRCFANGTATMKIALQVAGIGPGDEVITTPISWVATSNVILAVGAKPVFVDIDPKTRNLDLHQVQSAINNKTKAIMPVYLAGLPLDIDALYTIAENHQLRVIEDA